MCQPGAPKLSQEKLDGVERALAALVPAVQNKETFSKSYTSILGELYKTFQLEAALKETTARGSGRSVILSQLANKLVVASSRSSSRESIDEAPSQTPRRTPREQSKPRKNSIINAWRPSRISMRTSWRRSSNTESLEAANKQVPAVWARAMEDTQMRP